MGGSAARTSELDTVDAAYRLEGTTEDWLARVVEAARPALDEGLGLIGWTFEVLPAGTVRFSSDAVPVGIDEAVPPLFVRISESLNAGNVSESFAHPRFLETASTSIVRQLGEPVERTARPYFEPLLPWGIVDCVGAKALDPTGIGVLIAAPRDRFQTIADAEEARWSRVMTHVLSGLRLRHRLAETAEDDEAVVDPARGRVVHAQGAARSASAREALREAAVHIDRARARAGRSDPEAALEAWKGLVEARWSVLERFDHDGRRFFVARPNDFGLPDRPPLTRREQQVIACVALGRTNKQTAYALGIAPSTVSSHLSSAMKRLGITDLASLAALYAPVPEGDD